MTDVMSGQMVFKLADTQGLPLWLVLTALRQHGKAFDVAGYVSAARQAGWKDETTRRHLFDAAEGLEQAADIRTEVERLLTR
jgi:alanyl-tRNA synthetase